MLFRSEDYWSWLRRGDALRHLGDYPAAIASYEQALQIDLKAFSAWYKRGETCRYLHRYDEAISSYQQALRLEPDDEYAWYNQACCAARLGQVELVLKCLQKAIHYNPGNREFAARDRDFYAMRGNWQFQGLVRAARN